MDPRYKSPTANVEREADEYEFRDLEQFTNVLKWMLWIGAAFSAIAIVSSVSVLNLLSRSYDQEELQQYIMREAAVGGLTALYLLATVIVFGRWIVLAHRNLPALGARVVEVTPGWAVGWFFVPIVNLWFPYRAMRFLWRSSHSAQRPDLQDSTWVLPTWWGLWLIMSFLPLATSAMRVQMNTVEGLAGMARSETASRLAWLALYIVASVLVTRIWEAQRSQKENPGEFDPEPGFADA